MKKLLLTLCLFVFWGYGAAVFAQCTPDTSLKNVGIYPEDSLPSGEIGKPYQAVIQVVLPKDTSVVIFGQTVSASFCSFAVDTLFLPPGLTYQCNDPDCEWDVDHTPGAISRGCIYISGTPLARMDTLRGLIKITPGYIDSVNNNACDADSFRNENRAIWPFIQAFLTQDYANRMHIGGFGVAIEDPLARERLQLQLYPNPAGAQFGLDFVLDKPQQVSAALYDLMGRRVAFLFDEQLPAGQISREFPSGHLNDGMYLLQLSLQEPAVRISQKLIIKQ